MSGNGPKRLEQYIPHLEELWTEPDGVLYRLRQGQYDDHAVVQMKAFLRTIPAPEVDCLPKHFVTLIWFIPVFMYWQRQRVEERGGSAATVDADAEEVAQIIIDILGWP